MRNIETDDKVHHFNLQACKMFGQSLNLSIVVWYRVKHVGHIPDRESCSQSCFQL